MSIDDVTAVAQTAIFTIIKCAAPLLLVSLSGHQYLPDSYVHSGTDAYLRTEDTGDFSGSDYYGALDHEQHGGIYDQSVV